MISLTNAERRAIVDVSDGQFLNLHIRGHKLQTISRLNRRKLIHTNESHLPIQAQHYTATADGMSALRVTA